MKLKCKVRFDEVESALLNVLEGASSLGIFYFGPDSMIAVQGQDRSNLQRETLVAYRVSSVEQWDVQGNTPNNRISKRHLENHRMYRKGFPEPRRGCDRGTIKHLAGGVLS